MIMASIQNSMLSISRRKLITQSAGLIIGATFAGKLTSAFAEIDNDITPTTFTIPDSNSPIRVNFNENALGMSLKAQQAAKNSVIKANRYAKHEINELQAMIADSYQLPLDAILLTQGSSEGIRASIQSHGSPMTQLVIPTLTYNDGEEFAKTLGLKITKIPCVKNWYFDIEAMKNAVTDYKGSSIVYLVNPNNPTGTITAADLIEPWIQSKPANTLFIIDEAYAEFVNDPAFRSVTSLIQQGAENVLLLKTFSKIYAMAGMRVGFIVGHPNLIKKTAEYVAGVKLNYVAVEAAMACYNDKQFIKLSKESNDISRKIMVNILTELQLDYLPSETNFIFHKVTGSLEKYRQRMKEAHILIGRNFPPANEWCRISLGTPAEMTYIAGIMRKFHSQGWI